MGRDVGRRGEASDPGDGKPDAIINRDAEWTALSTTVGDPGSRHLHLHGPRGTGKTLLAEHAMEALPETGIACYVPCITADTQYKVLKRLYQAVTDEEIASGYHTSQLQDRLAERLIARPTVIVLDEVDFLLLNDGSDLLYYLSRIADDALSVITISANHADLSQVVDERTYSSLHPREIGFDPYTEQAATRILRARARDALDRTTGSDPAVRAITAHSTNLRLGLHWLAAALRQTEDTLTEAVVDEVRRDAVDRYRDTLLEDFSPHHRLGLDAITQLTTEEELETVRSGTVYERYTELCWETGQEPLTTRRMSDFLTHLELLGIVEAEYSYGGTEGKTRMIQLQHVR